jgi:hypothetical protein
VGLWVGVVGMGRERVCRVCNAFVAPVGLIASTHACYCKRARINNHHQPHVIHHQHGQGGAVAAEGGEGGAGGGGGEEEEDEAELLRRALESDEIDEETIRKILEAADKQQVGCMLDAGCLDAGWLDVSVHPSVRMSLWH